MAVSRTTKSASELDDEAVVDAIRSYIALQSRDWQRRQRERIIKPVLRMVDEARDQGDSPDVLALIKQVFLDRELPKIEMDPE